MTGMQRLLPLDSARFLAAQLHYLACWSATVRGGPRCAQRSRGQDIFTGLITVIDLESMLPGEWQLWGWPSVMAYFFEGNIGEW